MVRVSPNEYLQKEQEFIERTDSLCENTPVHLCDCSQCPTQELCKWLSDHSPSIREG